MLNLIVTYERMTYLYMMSKVDSIIYVQDPFNFLTFNQYLNVNLLNIDKISTVENVLK